jgi:outer membrane immunogenic protein
MKSIRIASLAAAILVLPLAAQAQSDNSWQGPYAGINVGGLFSSTSATIGENNAVGGFSGNGSGFMGGAQAGYNWMVGPVMLGGELDFQGSTETTNLFGGAGSSQIAATSAIPWFSTFRARVGYPVGSVMPYITGGAVWGHQTLSGFDTAVGNFSASNNFWTYVVGVGMEGRIAQAWTAKLEYLWIGTPDTALSSPTSTSISERSIGNVVRVGLNYHF